MRAPALAVCALLLGCQPGSNVCDQRSETLRQGDGTPYRCTRAEDCPRPANVFICTTNGLPENECVSCDETVCLRHIPEPCQ